MAEAVSIRPTALAEPAKTVRLPLPLHQEAARLLRAVFAGGAATIVDLAVLAALVSGLGVAPRIASLPALILGGVVSFFANRHWVFRANGPSSNADHARSLPVQAALYVIVELVALALNGVLFDAAMRAPFIHAHASWYLPTRLVTSHIVFLVWSYPLWRFVFGQARKDKDGDRV